MLALGYAKKYDLKEETSFQKVLKFAGEKRPGFVKVSNIFGSILVEGYDGREVRMKVKETISADSKELIEKAKKEVDLKMETDGDRIKIYVDGPFRREDGRWNWDQKKIKYIVKYDIKMKVPRMTNLSASTINDGLVEASDIVGKVKLSNINGGVKAGKIKGDFKISSINGKVVLNGLAGSGSASTINGVMKVSFTRNPSSNCSFSSLNGDVDLTFQKGLNADLKLSTLNGKVFTDFEPSYLSTGKSKGKRTKGMFVYKSNKYKKVRIGKGGINFKISTLNGNIYIAKVK
jgi:hypothetical protein